MTGRNMTAVGYKDRQLQQEAATQCRGYSPNISPTHDGDTIPLILQHVSLDMIAFSLATVLCGKVQVKPAGW